MFSNIKEWQTIIKKLIHINFFWFEGNIISIQSLPHSVIEIYSPYVVYKAHPVPDYEGLSIKIQVVDFVWKPQGLLLPYSSYG